MSHVRSLIALTALTSASMFACAAGVSPETTTNNGTLPPTPTVEAGTFSPAATDFQVRSDTRDAWLALAQWTHFYAISVANGAGDTAQAQDRLIAAGDDFATQTGALLGDSSASQLTELLAQRAKIVAAFVTDTENGDENAIKTEGVSWQGSSSSLASFFATKLETAHAVTALAPELTALDTATQNEIVARAQGDFAAEITASDAADTQALAIGDTIALSLAASFPTKLAPSTLTATSQSLRLELRSLLTQRAFWLRAFTIDQVAKKDAQPELDRAITAHVAVSDIFAGYFGKNVGDQVELGFHNLTADTYAFLLAVETGDPTAPNAIRTQWMNDATAFAQYLASTDPNWNEADLNRLLQVDVDRTLADLEARQSSQWDADVADWQMVVDDTGTFADMLAGGLATAFPSRPH